VKSTVRREQAMSESIHVNPAMSETRPGVPILLTAGTHVGRLKKSNLLRCMVPFLACALLSGCGSHSTTNSCVIAPRFFAGVGGYGSIADHNATPPGNQLTVFADFGEYAVSGDCPPMPVDLDSPVQASWTSSDPSAVTINSGPIGPVLGYNGTVTCLSAAGLVTATASYVSPDFPGRTLIASTQFTCQ
jgi:hypothetical protein